jgi:hypothetical protein
MKTLLAFLFAVLAPMLSHAQGGPPVKSLAPKMLSPQFICATPWKFDHPDTKNVPLRLRSDGTCESKNWKGLWTQTAPSQITLVISGGKKSVLVIAEDGKTYAGTHFDGNPVIGKRVGDVPPISRY